MKTPLTFLIFIFLGSLTAINAQNSLIGQPVPPTETTELRSKFAAVDVYELDLADLQNQLRSGSTVEVLLDERQWQLEVTPVTVLGYNFQVRTGESNGESFAPDLKFYRGSLAGSPGSSVSITIGEGFFYGFVSDGAQIEYFEPARGFQTDLAANHIVVYEPTAITSATGTCAVSEAQQHDEDLRDSPTGNSRFTGDCFTVELAIASDFSYYQARGSSLNNVINYTAGVMANVQTNYSLNGNTNFDDGVEYLIVENFVATTAASDPWTSSADASALLNSFTNWANGGGFNATHDLGQLWTDRDLTSTTNGTTSSGVVGLAWTGTQVVCSANRYHILEDFSSNADQLRVLVAHEIGHNWGANHDPSGSNFIMAPSVTITSNWSSLSQNQIQQGIDQAAANCLSSCGNGPPISDFTANSTVGCPGSSIQFENISGNGANVFSWSFPGGTPATSTQANPVVTYPAVGTYSVSFTATNNQGTGNTETKPDFIRIVPAPAGPTCTPSTTPGSGGIRRFAIGTVEDITGTAAADGAAYLDKACDDIISLEPNLVYPVEITVGNPSCSGANPFAFVRIFLDYNNDGDFNDANELVATSGGQSFCGPNINNSFQIPLDIQPVSNPPVVNQVLRLRVIATSTFSSDPCVNPGSGQVIDYGAAFINQALLPVELLDFTAIAVGNTVHTSWVTATEIDNDYFRLERSADGRQFEEITTVAGAGTITSRQDYRYVDQQPLSGTSYYRLAQYDYDGTRTYSDVVSVTRAASDNWQVSPNPLRTEALQIRYAAAGPAVFNLYDTNGRVVKSWTFTDQAATTQLRELDLTALPQGIYTLTLRQADQTQTERIVRL